MPLSFVMNGMEIRSPATRKKSIQVVVMVYISNLCFHRSWKHFVYEVIHCQIHLFLRENKRIVVSRIIEAFVVVVSTLPLCSSNNGVHGFETAQMQHNTRCCWSHSPSTTRGASLDHCHDLSIRHTSLGLLRRSNNENNSRNHHLLCAVQNTDSDSGYDRSLLVLATVPISNCMDLSIVDRARHGRQKHFKNSLKIRLSPTVSVER